MMSKRQIVCWQADPRVLVDTVGAVPGNVDILAVVPVMEAALAMVKPVDEGVQALVLDVLHHVH